MKMPAEHIRDEIVKTGDISFARFMELALYCPETGYYEKKKDNVGHKGDFITSVSVGSLFGEMLACQFAHWLDELKTSHEKLKIIEAGAHDGKLAADILNWLKIRRPNLFAKTEYYLLEPSPKRQDWQRETLKDFGGQTKWFEDIENLKLKTKHSELQGILFSNELLDAFPVHRLGWDARKGKWFEWGVTLEDDDFTWTHLPCPDDGRFTIEAPRELLAVLPDNYIIELSPAAEKWWHAAGSIFTHGKWLAIDYGLAAGEMFSPGRPHGTLRAYSQHHISDNLLAEPGGQDLTAHVNFAAIQKAGKSAGLRTELFCTQPQFLTQILGEATKKNWLGDWDAKRTRQFQTLTHPEHLGRAFRVLVQSK